MELVHFNIPYLEPLILGWLEYNSSAYLKLGVDHNLPKEDNIQYVFTLQDVLISHFS